MTIDPVAKVLISLGVLLIVVGVLWHLGWLQALRIGRLPGDIAIEKENVKIYFPITTMILVSVVLTALSWLYRRFF